MMPFLFISLDASVQAKWESAMVWQPFNQHCCIVYPLLIRIALNINRMVKTYSSFICKLHVVAWWLPQCLRGIDASGPYVQIHLCTTTCWYFACFVSFMSISMFHAQLYCNIGLLPTSGEMKLQGALVTSRYVGISSNVFHAMLWSTILTAVLFDFKIWAYNLQGWSYNLQGW